MPQAQLRNYQHQGVEFLLAGNGRLLADEMGLGKTVQVAVALRHLRQRGELQRALIVCPASLIENWRDELRQWGPRCAVGSTLDAQDATEREWLYRLPLPILLTSYENLRVDFLPRGPSVTYDVVVFDEAQRVKNNQSTTAIAARHVSARRRWLLSATPLENGLSDLGSIASVMGIFPHQGHEQPDPSVLTDAFQGNFLRRRKPDVLPELPAIIGQELHLKLSEDQLLEYNAEAAEHAELGSITDVLGLITRLKRICNRGTGGSSVKLDALRVLLDDPDTVPMKMIVVSQYVETLRWLHEELTVDSLLYTGDMGQEERQQTLAAFKSAASDKVLLMSLKAGGVGLNIQEATHIVLFDRWWTPAAELQAIARAHRFGRATPLFSYSFRVMDTVEDRIVQIGAGKQTLFDDLVEGRLVADADRAGWTRQDLIEVLRLPK